MKKFAYQATQRLYALIVGIIFLLILFGQWCSFKLKKGFLIPNGSLTVGYQKKVPAGRIKPAFFVSNFWFLSIVFYCNVL